MALLQQGKKRITGLQAPGRHAVVKEFKLVGQVADGCNLDHARAALEGVQVAQQVLDFKAVLRLAAPANQGYAGAFNDITGLLEKNLEQLVVGFFGGLGVGCQQWRLGGSLPPQRGRIQAWPVKATGCAGKFGDLAAAMLHKPSGTGCQAAVQELAQRLDLLWPRIHLLPGRRLIEHIDQPIDSLAGLDEKRLAQRQAALLYSAIDIQQSLAQLIDLGKVGNMSALPQGRQLIEQGRQILTLGRMLLPMIEQAFGIQKDIHPLLEKFADQLRLPLWPRRLGVVSISLFETPGGLPNELANQMFGTFDHRQRLARQALHTFFEGLEHSAQQLQLRRFDRPAMALELADHAIHGGGQRGNRQHPGHPGTALEGMHRTLHGVADEQRATVGRSAQKAFDGGQMGQRFVAENLQQLAIKTIGIEHPGSADDDRLHMAVGRQAPFGQCQQSLDQRHHGRVFALGAHGKVVEQRRQLRQQLLDG